MQTSTPKPPTWMVRYPLAVYASPRGMLPVKHPWKQVALRYRIRIK